MLVGAYQNHPEFGETQANVEIAAQDLSNVKADLVVLPELFNTGYQFVSRQEVETLAEEIPSGQTCQAMMTLARNKKMFLVFGMAERVGQDFFNSAVVIGPEGLWESTRKHIFFLKRKISLPREIQGFRSLI